MKFVFNQKLTIMKKYIAIAILCLHLGLSFHSDAQTLSLDTIKAQLVKDWQRAKAYTLEYLNTMPANKYSFKANDSVRSFAQQMLHLAQANVGLLSGAIPNAPSFGRANLEGSATAQTKDSVMYYVMTSYDFAINGIKNLSTSAFSERAKFFNFEESKFTWILKAFEHQTHHRGQTTIYIRLAGIKPPQEKLF
jgi:uncharacterized damage-inducible protein DinB